MYQQGLNFQNIWIAHITQQQNKQRNWKLGRWPKETFFQRRNIDGQLAYE